MLRPPGVMARRKGWRLAAMSVSTSSEPCLVMWSVFTSEFWHPMHVPTQLSTVPADQPAHPQSGLGFGCGLYHLPSLPLRVLAKAGTRALTLWLFFASHFAMFLGT